MEHEITTGTGAIAVAERQDIVYREAQKASAPHPRPRPRPEGLASEQRHVLEATTPPLFCYSVPTFNGHRIHTAAVMLVT
ncbi:MAG: hypothetical protein E5Y04_29980 [Mesorhizobium sp.]|uniref:hypothetical protein n=1 Tax=unclassified Mesorhizobium TaxID=325217 RepID=UPI000FC9E026|nr:MULTISPECIES: hypothetical protein [unclassified Mesorhizobium]RUV33375.1 hypothetical protein EOB49_30770 [Mesorhizobium sp. M7A.F.Ca.MR.148.00.0.0]RWN25181.1 MAG: hypothetical protein EOR97_32270 [Mesorhizobium sp.]RWN40551.1 MAG: hypothetical protein EOS03_31930 [Mesorhizobium sp.]RWO37889.1 MAG: hypothetical protein EOS12_31485 [Mesorhizobium sp.]TJV07611.1 MAG: hypothetical protein E5Y12_00260 [Mesorhizobium sp.]